MFTMTRDAEGYNFSVQMIRQVWSILSSFSRMGETTRLWMDLGNFSHLGLWISSLGLKMSSDKGLGWAFGMEGFWEIKPGVKTLGKL